MNILFNVRVYGILIENGNLLVADEKHYGKLITKLPGGGLQFGEGTIECIKREFLEELDIKIDIASHFYTVDFFQPSAFDNSQQVISIYYRVKYDRSDQIPVIDKKDTSGNLHDSYQAFRWVPLGSLSRDEFSFPIDKKVAELITKNIKDKKPIHV